jgi:hypothetical protein
MKTSKQKTNTFVVALVAATIIVGCGDNTPTCPMTLSDAMNQAGVGECSEGACSPPVAFSRHYCCKDSGGNVQTYYATGTSCENFFGNTTCIYTGSSTIVQGTPAEASQYCAAMTN